LALRTGLEITAEEDTRCKKIHVQDFGEQNQTYKQLKASYIFHRTASVRMPRHPKNQVLMPRAVDNESTKNSSGASRNGIKAKKFVKT
jgi:hypothetical protein